MEASALRWASKHCLPDRLGVVVSFHWTERRNRTNEATASPLLHAGRGVSKCDVVSEPLLILFICRYMRWFWRRLAVRLGRASLPERHGRSIPAVARVS